MSETTDEKQDTRFKKGASGNPSGRPVGARNKATVAAETLLDGEAEGLTRRAIEMAMEGDVTALRICLDRILPVRKGRLVTFNLPPISEPSDLLKALYEILAGVSKGELSPEEAHTVASLLEQTRRSQEVIELEERMQKMERHYWGGGHRERESN